jgi:hypothetical protein
VSVKECAVLALMASLELCADCTPGFMGPNKPSSSVTTSSNRTPCLNNVVGGGMRPMAKTSPVGRGLISMK